MLKKTLSLCDVGLKMSGEGERTFSGYASVFDGIDAYGDTIKKGAFKEAIKKGAGNVKMFFNHNSFTFPVGKWLAMAEDKKGLLVKGELTDGNRLAEDLRASLKHGTIEGLSIGFRLHAGDFEVTKDGEGRIIKNMELVEISPVMFPADESARIDLTSVKSALNDIKTIKDFEGFLRDEGHFSNSACKTIISRAKSIFQRDAGEIKQNVAGFFEKILEEQKNTIDKLKG